MSRLIADHRRPRLTAAILLVVAAAGLLATGSTQAADEIIDRVLAAVAGDVIMLSDVNAARELGLVAVGQGADPMREALSQLIDRSLILAEVDRYAPPDPSPDAVAEEMRLVGGRFPSPEAFGRVLARSGLDQKLLGETIRQNLRMRAYLTQRFSTDTPERRQSLIDDWVAGLRRRAEITELHVAPP